MRSRRSDYIKYAYQCYDVLHIPGTAPRKRSNYLNVNGHTIKMPDEASVGLPKVKRRM